MRIVPTPQVMPRARVKMETRVLCVIREAENELLLPANRSWVAFSTSATRRDGSCSRCEKGIKAGLEEGSKVIAKPPNRQPATVIASDMRNAGEWRRKVWGSVWKNQRKGKMRRWRSRVS